MRIAQLTDLHLRDSLWGPCAVSRRRSHHMVRLLTIALEQIKKRNVDLLVVTGDLLDVPSWIERPMPGFQYDTPDVWQAAALRDYQLVRRMLDESQLKYMVLPGNHDAPSLMWQVFDQQADEMDVAGWRVVRFCDYEHEGNQAHRYSPQRLRWDELVAAEDGPPQIHLQHYLLDSAHNEGYPHGYAEADFLRRSVAESARVKLCLSGHYHHGTGLQRDGGCWFSVSRALCQSPYCWREYELSDDGERCTMIEHELGIDAIPARRVVFLDRDGVINDLPSYRVGPEAMRLIPGSAHAIRRLNDAGLAVVVVTSQSAVGAGYVPRRVMHAVNDRMCRLLFEEAGATLDAIYASLGAGPAAVLPGYDDLSNVKPQPAMLLRARDELHLDMTDAWMVGDGLTDAMAGEAAGATPVLVRTGHGRNDEQQFREKYPDAPVIDDLAALHHAMALR